ncbi:hypothetical protein SAMN04488490_0020 [Marinobacter sp. LV10R510-11A]|uniref:O-antigen ligase family protein n=1 Tax=Marinobacter sp. LV10R510-11A TaxID=1415568 RepID=UPI000BB68738|nr:O-antigen ligase family protein [Marinobacter sp. LV10R510-11A]SOB74541.1 hypothetical protein SAMN04488490_0020 [Marinobacter sp. LV10R510-11A]
MEKVFPAESAIALLVFLQIVQSSIISIVVSTSFFNGISLVICFWLISLGVKVYNDLLFIVLLSVTLIFSMLVNVSSIEQGGYNTFILFVSCLVLLSTKINKINIDVIKNKIALITIIFLGAIYLFFILKIQPTPGLAVFILSGPYLNQNTTSMICLALLVLLGSSNYRKSRFIEILMVVLFFSILLTQARAAFLCASIYLAFYFGRRALISAPIILLIITLYFLNNPESYSRVVIKLSDSGGSGRLEFWIKAFLDLTESVLPFMFGVGINQMMINLGDSTLSVHNSYINFFASYGVVALIVLLSYLFYIVSVSFRASKLLCASLIVFLLYGMFETVLFGGYEIVWIVFIILYVLRDEVKTPMNGV